MNFSRSRSVFALVGFFVILQMMACKSPISPPADIEHILSKAGDNRGELEDVIRHYSRQPEDSLKLRAAYFLIKNMDGMKALDTSSVESNKIYFDAIHHDWQKSRKKLESSRIKFIVDSINKDRGIVHPDKLNIRYQNELLTVSADFLIDNIDQAFHAWQNMPWSKHIPFKDFCEYILPYRCTDTYSPSFRASFFADHKKVMDSVNNSGSSFKAGGVMVRNIDSWFLEETQLFSKNPYLRPMKFSDILKGKVGLCIDANSVKVTALRALGIPAALDEVPNWGSTNGSHYWYKIIDPANDTIKALITNKNSTRSTDHIVSTSSYWPREIVFEGIPKSIEVSYIRTVPKVYRNAFAKQKDNLAAAIKSDDEVPTYFRNQRLKDVTNQYVVSSNVTRKLNQVIDSQKYAYLCVYDNHTWKPITWGLIKHNVATFKNMGRNIVYLPAYYSHNEVVPAGNPFLLNLNGVVEEIAPEHKTQTIELYTKYPYRNFVHFSQMCIMGGRFQFANKADLSDSVTIHKISKLPFYATEIPVNNLNKFRYLYFQFASMFTATFAEMEFYYKNEKGEDIKLNGRLIGNKGNYPSTADKMFDGDVLTTFTRQKEKETYVGIDLGTNNVKQISKIRFIPRTDDNIVTYNEEYELFYWREDAWVSLGSNKAGKTNTVLFKQVPTNALLLLKNRKGGTENRIFTYQKGKQLFW